MQSAGIRLHMQSLMRKKGLTYETWRKRAILDVIADFGGPFTVLDVSDGLIRSRQHISRATIYRTLNALWLEGAIRQIILPNGRYVFAAAVDQSALCVIECVDCGKLSSCETFGFDQCFVAEASRRFLRPLQTSTYMQAKCCVADCIYRRLSEADKRTSEIGSRE